MLIETRALEGSELVAERLPTGRAAIDLEILAEQATSDHEPEPPGLLVNGQTVECGYGRWLLMLPPGRTEVQVVRDGSAYAFSVSTPRRKIRKLRLIMRPADSVAPVAVHCPYRPPAGPNDFFFGCLFVVLAIIALINVIGRIIFE